MARLFLLIISAIVVTILTVSYGVELLSEKLLSHYEKPFYSKTFNGVFQLLDHAVAGRSEESIESVILELQKKFKYPVYRKKLDELGFPESIMNVIRSGEIHIQPIEGADHLYRLSGVSESVWQLAVQLNNNDANIAIVVGPIELILERLAEKSFNGDQQSTMVKIASDFGIPVTVAPFEAGNFTQEENRRLESNLVVAREPGQNGERYFRLIPDTGAVLTIGPIPFPVIVSVIEPLILGITIVLFALCSFIWVGPLWRDLRQLISTSNDIADGQLDARVQSTTPSMIRPVIVGFNHMADQTEKMLASQQALTDAVSHELRTPLARLTFSLGILDQTDSESLRKRHRSEMARDLDELNQLVDELLTFARYDRIGTDFDIDQLPQVCISNWMREQVDRSRRNIPNKCDVTYKSYVSEQESARFHKRLMSYAISNGLGNAIRYAKTTVRVTFYEDQHQYIVHIEDDGPGIEKEARQVVFEAFSRTDESRSRDSGGFGLGLSIVKKVADWHNGSATILDSNLGGVTLQISWPVERCDKTGPIDRQ